MSWGHFRFRALFGERENASGILKSKKKTKGPLPRKGVGSKDNFTRDVLVEEFTRVYIVFASGNRRIEVFGDFRWVV